MHKLHLMPVYFIPVCVSVPIPVPRAPPPHLRLLAGISPMTETGSRQGGSQDRIPRQWVLGIGCLNRYKSQGYFFFQGHFHSEKHDILARRKASRPLCILPPLPWRTMACPSKSEAPQEARGPLYPKLNTFLEGERISQSPGLGFSSVPILFLLLGLIKTCWVCFEDKGKNNITLF